MPWKVFAGVVIVIVLGTIAGVVGGVKASNSSRSPSPPPLGHHIINDSSPTTLSVDSKAATYSTSIPTFTDSARRPLTADGWYFILNTNFADNPRILETTLYLEKNVALEYAYVQGDNISQYWQCEAVPQELPVSSIEIPKIPKRDLAHVLYTADRGLDDCLIILRKDTLVPGWGEIQVSFAAKDDNNAHQKGHFTQLPEKQRLHGFNKVMRITTS